MLSHDQIPNLAYLYLTEVFSGAHTTISEEVSLLKGGSKTQTSFDNAVIIDSLLYFFMVL